MFLQRKVAAVCAEQPVQEVRVKVVEDENVVIMSPVDSVDCELMQQILNAPSACRTWRFKGSSYERPGKQNLLSVAYACGGEPAVRYEANAIHHTHFGVFELRLLFASDPEETAKYSLRNWGFFSGGVVVMPDSTADAMRLACAVRCKVCGGELDGLIEWQTCNSCAAKCEHVYVEGVGQANGHIAYLPFCDKCGRGDPSWEPGTPAEEAVKTVALGGLDALFLEHGDGTSTLITKK